MRNKLDTHLAFFLDKNCKSIFTEQNLYLFALIFIIFLALQEDELQMLNASSCENKYWTENTGIHTFFTSPNYSCSVFSASCGHLSCNIIAIHDFACSILPLYYLNSTKLTYKYNITTTSSVKYFTVSGVIGAFRTNKSLFPKNWMLTHRSEWYLNLRLWSKCNHVAHWYIMLRNTWTI